MSLIHATHIHLTRSACRQAGINDSPLMIDIPEPPCCSPVALQTPIIMCRFWTIPALTPQLAPRLTPRLTPQLPIPQVAQPALGQACSFPVDLDTLHSLTLGGTWAPYVHYRSTIWASICSTIKDHQWITFIQSRYDPWSRLQVWFVVTYAFYEITHCRYFSSDWKISTMSNFIEL